MCCFFLIEVREKAGRHFSDAFLSHVGKVEENLLKQSGTELSLCLFFLVIES